ncbi:hypothetical protein PCE1_004252 [Barthelona sp. PCE]
MFNQPNQYGQQPQQYGQPMNQGFGQPQMNQGFGQPGMGQPGMGMGQPGMGQPGMGMPGMQPGMGQPGMGMGQPGMGMGQPGMGMGQPGMGMGQPGMGMPGMQPGMGQPGMGMGQPGMGQPGMGMPGMQPGMGQPGMGMGQPGMGQPGMGMPGMQPQPQQNMFAPSNNPFFAPQGQPAPISFRPPQQFVNAQCSFLGNPTQLQPAPQQFNQWQPGYRLPQEFFAQTVMRENGPQPAIFPQFQQYLQMFQQNQLDKRALVAICVLLSERIGRGQRMPVKGNLRGFRAMNQVEQLLVQECGQGLVTLKEPQRHLEKANGYQNREIMALFGIIYSRLLEKSDMEQAPRPPCPTKLESIFFAENPSDSPVYSYNLKFFLDQANQLPTSELFAFVVLGAMRVYAHMGQTQVWQ